MTRSARVTKDAATARPSNTLCCNTVKLQGVPNAARYRPVVERRAGHQGNVLGYGKNASDATMDNLQPIPTGARA